MGEAAGAERASHLASKIRFRRSDTRLTISGSTLTASRMHVQAAPTILREKASDFTQLALTLRSDECHRGHSRTDTPRLSGEKPRRRANQGQCPVSLEPLDSSAGPRVHVMGWIVGDALGWKPHQN
jgi:hypothetical protein